MTQSIYALLIGIDQYPEGINSLQGCVNDISAIADYLNHTAQVNAGKFQLHLKKLLNQEATRSAIINGFQTHLYQAQRDDIAFFYYSGHGSNEIAPPEFMPIEPDRQLETIVCYDSRLEGGFDLADKELAYLLSKASHKPQFVLVLDSCHSGSGFRVMPQEGVRQTSGRELHRSMKDFIFSLEEMEAMNAATEFNPKNRSGWRFATGDHILLAACLESELAKERNKRGVFSYFLLDTLQKANGRLTYREVFDRAKALVCAHEYQSPQLEVTKPEFWDLPFLGFEDDAATSHRRYATLSSEEPGENSRWLINLGAIHHIPENPTTPVRFEVYQADNWTVPVGEVEVTEVLPEKSIVSFLKAPANLTSETVLNAVITNLPIPPLNVFLDGDRDALQLVQQELADTPYIKMLTADTAEYRLLARHNHYSITKPHDDRPLVKRIGYSPDNAKIVARQLEYIARWLIVLKQENPASSLPTHAVKMQIYRNNQELREPELRLEYQRVANKWQQPTVRIKLTNTTRQRLYCTLLDLSALYGISSPFFNHAGVWLDGGRDVWVTFTHNGTSTTEIPFALPGSLREQGVTEYQDFLKLIVSTAEFDIKPLLQVRLDAPDFGSPKRDIEVEPDTPPKGDWVTSLVAVTTIRPQDDAVLTEGKAASLGLGVTIQAPIAFQATAKLIASQDTREATQQLPLVLREHTQPFHLAFSRCTDSNLDTLELKVQNTIILKTITPETPLKLTVEQSLEPGEYVLPVAYDGEFVIPLGQGVEKDGGIEIRIDRLPEPPPIRSLGGSVRILFCRCRWRLFLEPFALVHS